MAGCPCSNVADDATLIGDAHRHLTLEAGIGEPLGRRADRRLDRVTASDDRAALLACVHGADHLSRPCETGITAPERPRDTTCARIAVLTGSESFGLLVYLVAAEEVRHPAHRVR